MYVLLPYFQFPMGSSSIAGLPARPTKWSLIFKSKKIWCAASTHNPEEKICALAHKKLKNKYNNLLTIIIPRHIERTAQIKREIEKFSLKTHLRSSGKKISKDIDVYIVDTYGELNKFYKINKITKVGRRQK